MTAAMSADYGARARVGVATPQANPTVEPELRALLPADIGVYATRLVHPAPRVEERLAWYIRHMPEAVRSFGTMNLRAFGFGCTGSSYVAGSGRRTGAGGQRHRHADAAGTAHAATGDGLAGAVLEPVPRVGAAARGRAGTRAGISGRPARRPGLIQP